MHSEELEVLQVHMLREIQEKGRTPEEMVMDCC
jgi:hypothetical protein